MRAAISYLCVDRLVDEYRKRVDLTGRGDAQVARVGVSWAEKPWIPPIRIAQERTRKVWRGAGYRVT